MTSTPLESPAQGAILIVDDSPEVLASLAALLGEQDEVIIATSGLEGYELALTEAPDLVLLDVMMPDMDGYALCRQLKETPSTADIPVIFLTGRIDEADEARGLCLGAMDYLRKPVNPVIALARIHNQLRQKRQRDVLKGLSYRDALTGIANRRQFEITLEAEWKRAMRSHRPLSLVMLDVDFFKRYNDTLGHPAGDECLRRLAAALEAALHRKMDLAARFGGEEFVCILPETDEQGALLIGEQIQGGIAALDLAHPDSPAGPWVTVSLGCATQVPAMGSPWRTLLEAADQALYQAKRSGRGRLVMAGEPVAVAAEPSTAQQDEEPRVLLVEDDARMAALLRGRLEHLGAALTWVPRAEAALDALAGQRFQVILSDVVMPGMDGFELCRRVKADPRFASTPFAVLTSLSRNLRERSTQVGADDYLSKLEEETVFRMRTRTLLELGVRGPGAPGAGGGGLLLISAAHGIRTQVQLHLAGTGFGVRTAQSLAEARALIDQEAPSMLLLDLDLGEADPAGWIRELQGQPDLPAMAVLLLASKAEEALLPAYQDVADDRLPKPLEAAETRHRVTLMGNLARARMAAWSA